MPAPLLIFTWLAAAPQMVLVPAGTFTMGSTAGDPDERPPVRVTLSAFELQRTEVTQGEYAACVRAGRCRPPRIALAARGPRKPVVGVSWHDGARYCAWRGWRLPTEAEWERAAAGLDGRGYPWGKGIACGRANFGNFEGDGPCAGKNPGAIVAVGSYPAGRTPLGIDDLAGNVWEWVADWYAPRRRGGHDPRGPGRGSTRVLRGGACCSYFAMPTASNRFDLDPDYAGFDVGFRCARTVGGAGRRAAEAAGARR